MRGVGAQVAGKSQALVQFLGGLAGEQRTYACLQLAATLVSQAEAQVLPLDLRVCVAALGMYACLQLAATLVSQAKAQVLSLERSVCFPALGRLRMAPP